MSKKSTASKTTVPDKDKATKKEIISYGLGGAACTMPAQFKTSFSMSFMSDVAKINVGIVGVWISLMTIWDAINDPIIGGIADRTNSKRFGKYRPHMIMGSILWGVVTFLLFCSPNLNPTAKLTYYVVMLFLFSIFYTQFTVPWQALNSVMSADPHQRNLLLTSRQLAGFFVGAVVGIVTMPIVNTFAAKNNGNEEFGWMVAAGIVAVVTILTGLLCANGVKSKDYYGSIPNPPKSNFKGQMGLILKNKAVICAALLLGLVTLINAINAAISLYYLKYVVQNTNVLTLLSIAALPASLIIIPLMPTILKKIGKPTSLMIGMLIVFLGSSPLIFLRENASVPIIIAMYFITAVGFTMANMVCMSLIPDCTDYTELHFGSAQAGFINAMITFFKKMCQSLSTLIVGGLLALVGYKESTALGDPKVLNMILNIKILMPITLLVLVAIVLKIYPITPKYGIEMREKLAIIRAEKAKKN